MNIVFDFDSRPITLSHGELTGQLSLSSERINVLAGENGSGKSSLFQFLKLNSKEIFKGKKTYFLSQRPLVSLNEITVSALFEMMSKDFFNNLNSGRYSSLSFFEKTQFNLKLNRKVNDLSGGENQILKLLIALNMNVDLYFLDEPSSFLDKEKLGYLVTEIKRLRENKKTILIIDHNKEFIKELAVDTEHFLSLQEGQLIVCKEIK
jgi:translation initiation factor RLI1